MIILDIGFFKLKFNSSNSLDEVLAISSTSMTKQILKNAKKEEEFSKYIQGLTKKW